CVKGHRWSTTPEIISQGSWCQVCYYSSRVVHTIEDMHRIAQEKGGYCLSTKYITSHTYLDWQCKEGHIWKAKPASILNGSWCKFCAYRRKVIWTIEDMKKIAQNRNGYCLSTEYINIHTRLDWQCIKGHLWQAKPSYVIYNNTWCPYC